MNKENYNNGNKIHLEEEIIKILKREGKLTNVVVFNKKAFLFKLKKKLYDKDLIFTASYFVIDDETSIFIDENEKEWLVYLFGDKQKIKIFFNFLINYYFYRERTKENKGLKEKLINLSFFGSK